MLNQQQTRHAQDTKTNTRHAKHKQKTRHVKHKHQPRHANNKHKIIDMLNTNKSRQAKHKKTRKC